MKFIVYYGARPRLTNADRHDFDRGDYECAYVMRNRHDEPVIVSRHKNSSLPLWKVETGYSCFVFRSETEAMEFCNRRYRKTKGAK